MKLTQQTQGVGVNKLTPPLSTGQVTEQQQKPDTPVPFQVLPPKEAKQSKQSKASKEPKAKRQLPQEWFNENIAIGDLSAVLQVRNYPAKGHGQGFHCAPCGIAGRKAYVVRGKDGRGEDIELYAQNPETREYSKSGEVVKGFLIGAGCLKKYGKIDVSKVE